MNKWDMIAKVLGFVLNQIGVEAAKNAIDSLLDQIEKAAVGKSFSPMVMQSTGYIRTVLSVPDEPGENQANPT